MRRRSKRALDGIELVFHEAAVPSVPRSLADPIASHDANATGTLKLLQARQDGRGPAGGLRRLLVGLRRHADPAQGRDDAAHAALALCRVQAGRRALLPGVRRRLRARDGLPPLLQRVRPSPGSAVAVRGGHPALRDRCAGAGRRSPSTATARSRATSASSTTPSRRTWRPGQLPASRGASSTSPAGRPST